MVAESGDYNIVARNDVNLSPFSAIVCPLSPKTATIVASVDEALVRIQLWRIRFEIRIVMPDSIRYSIRTQMADSQVPKEMPP